MGSKGTDKPRVVVILGPTASGKSDLAINLAEEFGGEVVSADSRQVYKGMDLGTGKVTPEEKKRVPHHLLDVADPKETFTAGQFKRLGEKSLRDILERGKIPIVCGGTAFYIKILIGDMELPKVPPDWSIRKKLEKRSNEELYQELYKKDPERARNIDKHNKRRIIRALEIIEKTGKPVPKNQKGSSPYNVLFLGIDVEREKLHEKIERRLKERVDQGMIKEVQELKDSGVSWERLEEFGLEYRWVARYLQGKVSYEEMMESLLSDIKKFSKRQRLWWKNDERINWIKTQEEARELISDFLRE